MAILRKVLPVAVLVLALLPRASAEEEPEKEVEEPSVYYWNSVTGESQWERPAVLGHISTVEEHNGATYWIDPETEQATWEKPAAYDWKSEVHEGREYYYNLPLDKKQWEKPVELGWQEVPYEKEKEDL
eukprot:TRINITY_DN13566_c0_g1_i2.p1 TRINITY_DN13566_c0_g1~~TRINITY_DN13566_c0_g1_i2.p1  ORF type:complete len:129 (+),score=56.48 TRINITY_DN13566_c0_g1_i2:65-451(+)